MPRKVFDPCKVSACRIQTCLKENNYQEEKCLDVLEDMRKCCLQWKSVSLCCEGIDTNSSAKIKETTSNVKTA